MGFSAPFIARPVATILLSLGLLLSGVVAYRFLPVAALPSVDIPTIVVFAARPGADPETMANSIAAPLERRLGEISGVTEITSTSSIGNTSIVVQFDIDRDINGAAHDVQAAINAAITDLPSDLPTRPYYRKFNPADAPIMTIALSSDTLTTAQIYDAADTILAQRLSQADGVSQVTVNGAEKPAVRVRLDPVRLAAAGLAGQDVLNAIRGTNVLEPTGAFQGPDRAETIGINGQISQASDYAPLVLKAGNGAILRLSDVATVIDGVANTRLAAWNGKQPAILLTITKSAGANVIDTVDRIKALLPQLMEWLPADIKLTIISDRTTTIRASRRRRAVHHADHHRAGAAGGAAVHAPPGADNGRRGHRAAVDLRHARRHVVHGLSARQLLADGADHIGRLRGGRCDRDDREHRPPPGTRRRSDARGADRRAADRLHRDVDQHLAGRGVHPADLHGRHPGPAVPRVRHDADHGDRCLRGRVADADADDLRALHATRPACAATAALRRATGSRRWSAALPPCSGSTPGRSAGRCEHRVFMLLVTFATIVLTVRLYTVRAEGLSAVAGHRHPDRLDARLA